MDKEMLIKNLELQISHWREDDIIIESGYRKYNVDVNVVKTFIEEVRNGIYDVILKNDYWYGLPESDNLFSWYLFRIKNIENGIMLNDLTPENFFVFSKSLDLITMRFYSKPYISSLYSPDLIKLMSNNYSLKQVIELSKIFHTLSISNYNQDKIIELISLHASCANVDLEFNNQGDKLKKINLLSSEIQKKLSIKNLNQVFNGENSDCVVKYIKRMLISQLDIPKIIRLRSSIGYSNPDLQLKSKDELLKIVCSNINGDFKQFDDLTNEILFSNFNLTDNSNFLEEDRAKQIKLLNIKLSNLMNGILFSLMQKEEIINIKEKAESIQDAYKIGEYFRYITRYDNNKINLENGDTIFSIRFDAIDDTYLFWQKKYEFFYKNGTDGEFVKACTEIMCDMILSQMFLEGNKRTAKALFNSMLLSRNIIPPVIDMCEDDYSFFAKIALDRTNQCIEICYDVLKRLQNNNEQFSNGEYNSSIYINPSFTDYDNTMMMQL